MTEERVQIAKLKFAVLLEVLSREDTEFTPKLMMPDNAHLI